MPKANEWSQQQVVNVKPMIEWRSTKRDHLAMIHSASSACQQLFFSPRAMDSADEERDGS
jgi:hypothetical protein